MIVTDIILNKKNIVYLDPPNYYIKKNNNLVIEEVSISQNNLIENN